MEQEIIIIRNLNQILLEYLEEFQGLLMIEHFLQCKEKWIEEKEDTLLNHQKASIY